MKFLCFFRGTLVLPTSIILLVLLAACGRGGEPREITERRVLSERDRTVRLDATAEERFGYAEASRGPDRPVENPFRWENPGGWEELEPTSMRVANFRFGENGEGECYVTAMPGSGGGTVANLNRWRGQMGLEPWSEEEIAGLPMKTLLGNPAPFADIGGTFTGMGPAGQGEEPKENYRLLGVILSYDMFTLFVKMVGPADLVEKEGEKFDAFCDSLRIVSPRDPSI